MGGGVNISGSGVFHLVPHVGVYRAPSFFESFMCLWGVKFSDWHCLCDQQS